MISRESSVETAPPPSMVYFINQQRRHFSAAAYYPLRMKIVFGLMHSYNALAVLFIFAFPSIGIAALTAKFIIDSAIFYKGSALFGNTGLRGSVVPLELASLSTIPLSASGIFGDHQLERKQVIEGTMNKIRNVRVHPRIAVILKLLSASG